ncbi:MAG TPA: MDR/SDR family oxidoreductase, partial [Streptomyces sp.]
GQVRVALHTAGLNFRDVMISLGMYPGQAHIGSEGAGTVTETAPDVHGITIGDTVMGVLTQGVGPVTRTDHRYLAPVPDGWTLAEAATAPVAFLTAYYALNDLAGLSAGESVLIHAAAGGVGMAAVQIAQALGADVFTTASEGKWDALRALGIDDDHIASSRTADFETAFRQIAPQGVSVVLDALSGDLVDAGLRLLSPGGRFVEMGKTDLRDPRQIQQAYGVTYTAFDLGEVPAARIARMWEVLNDWFTRGLIRPLPRTVWDIRSAPEAFRLMAGARHVGKVVLTVPRPLDPDGTVLITGGTGTLGAHVARHFVTAHGIRHLVLMSRQGLQAPGAAALSQELAALGARVTVHAADVTDGAAIRSIVDGIAADRPLTAVVHAAGLVDDATAAALTPERLSAVMGPKVTGAWQLHTATRHLDLAAFVMFSSASGVLGGAGQANYAAANTFLDALAAHRDALGLPATSLAWGYWAEASGMTGHLTDADRARMARAGLVPLATEHGLALLDRALATPYPLLAPLGLDTAALSDAEPTPALLRGLARAPGRAAGRTARRAGG